MLQKLGRSTVRYRRLVIFLAVATVALSAAAGGDVVSSLTPGGFVSPTSESEVARLALLRDFDQGPPNVALLVSARQGTVEAPDVLDAGARLTRRITDEPGVGEVWSYFTQPSAPQLRSRDARQALILVRIDGDEAAVQSVIDKLSPAYTVRTPSISTQVGGSAEVARAGRDQVRADLERAEMISLPVLLLLLVLVFGSFLAALLPLAVGVFSIVGTMLLLQLISAVTDVSLFAMNMTTALGLGLAIDYSLIILSRYREQVRRGTEPRTAVAVAVRTAGRTVLFSAATVAASLSALLVFPTVFLRSFAYAAVAVVALATVGALVVLPALLACVAPHLDRWRLPITQAEVARHGEYAGGGWHRLASAVMRRPVVMGGGALLLLLVLGAPFLSVSFGLPDYRVLPAGTAAREVQEAINRGFVPGEGDNLFVVQRDDSSQAPTTGQIDAYASALSGIPNVARVDAASGSYVSGHKVAEARGSTGFLTAHRTWLSVVPATEPLSAQGEQLVSDVRDLPAPFPIQVGGSSAQFTDTKTALFSRLPTAFGLIAAVTFCLLFLFTASVLIPLKGLVLNVLSLTATFGAMVWVFQDGHLSGLLDFTPTGMLDTNMPILMFCVVFGLSMDYEVFLLSRIKEHYDATGNNDEAIAAGIQHTGRLITSAAALLATTFFAFAASGVSFVKLMGVGIALAVVVDATIVRAVLVPAFMRLAGPANWWSPAPLRVLHKVLVRGDIHGSDVPVAEHV